MHAYLISLCRKRYILLELVWYYVSQHQWIIEADIKFHTIVLMGSRVIIWVSLRGKSCIKSKSILRFFSIDYLYFKNFVYESLWFKVCRDFEVTAYHKILNRFCGYSLSGNEMNFKDIHTNIDYWVEIKVLMLQAWIVQDPLIIQLSSKNQNLGYLHHECHQPIHWSHHLQIEYGYPTYHDDDKWFLSKPIHPQSLQKMRSWRLGTLPLRLGSNDPNQIV